MNITLGYSLGILASIIMLLNCFLSSNLIFIFLTHHETDLLVVSSSIIICIIIIFLITASKMNSLLSLFLYQILIVCLIFVPKGLLHFFNNQNLHDSYFDSILEIFSVPVQRFYYIPSFILFTLSLICFTYSFYKEKNSTTNNIEGI